VAQRFTAAIRVTIADGFSRCGVISADRSARATRQSYNKDMPGAQPKRQPVLAPEHAPKPHIYSLEATGLLVIALLILILTLARYWYHIPWNAR
jgi:hypothetical protein